MGSLNCGNPGQSRATLGTIPVYPTSKFFGKKIGKFWIPEKPVLWGFQRCRIRICHPFFNLRHIWGIFTKIMSTLPKTPKSDIRAHKSGCTDVRFWGFWGGGTDGARMEGCSTGFFGRRERMSTEYLSLLVPQIFKNQSGKNQSGYTCKSNFFCWGGLRKGLEGVRSLLKPSSTFSSSRKIKF